MNTANNVLNTYLHFRDNGRADVLSVSESFWSELAAGKHSELNRGRLISAFTFSAPWSTWSAIRQGRSW
jgi:hypothetical protein